MNHETILRFRKQRGVNLGSWFVLEHWITDDPFRCAHVPGQSDLDVVRGADARRILEEHWDTWIRETDFAWLAQRGVNTVRIPIGYYHICGADPSVLKGTAFHDFGYVYGGAWSRITGAIELAEKYGMGVLIDLHAAPGKQNNDAHAGTSDASTFFSEKASRKHTITVLCTLVRLLKPFRNIIGVELLNEPHPPSDSDLQHWYTTTIREIRTIDPQIPLYLGECWRTDAYVTFVERLAPALRGGLLVLDHHLYRCFTGSDNTTKAAEHARALADPNGGTQKVFENAAERLGRAGGGLVVGEWSGALNPGSLEGWDGERKEYVDAQMGVYEKWCGGWFFWTYKKKGGKDVGWSFRDAVEAGVLPGWVGGIKVDRVKWEAKDRRVVGEVPVRKDVREKVIAGHIGYWAQYPGEYEHWRFGQGFDIGWADTYAFFNTAGRVPGFLGNFVIVPEIGFKGAWARRRTKDHGKGYWEYEHGFLQGAKAAEEEFRRVWGVK
ncbi:glycoside hydrolase superfamily [Collybia nuda]|uniref:Glycoside hydrolase superfamily n=1 Tax=Collybia nuda TaxID=64659 RepID=A0A9P5XZI2_9AGAR|nr:glycoside hydrolase superfamily [Collybia nuda]